MKKTIFLLLFTIFSVCSYSQNTILEYLGNTTVQKHNSSYVVYGDSIYQFFGEPYGAGVTVYSFRKDENNPNFNLVYYDSINQSRNSSIAFIFNNRAYIGFGLPPIPGSPTSRGLCDFYSFDFNTYTFDTLQSFPSYRVDVNWFLYNDKLYVGMGYEDSLYIDYNDFYEYDFITDNWSPSFISYPSISISGKADICFVSGDSLYIGNTNSILFGQQYDYYSINLTTGSYVNKISQPSIIYGTQFKFQNENYYMNIRIDTLGIKYYNLYKYNFQINEFSIIDSNISFFDSCSTISGFCVDENCVYFFMQNNGTDTLVKNQIWKLTINSIVTSNFFIEKNNDIKIFNDGFCLLKNYKQVYIFDINGQVIFDKNNYISNDKIYLSSGIYLVMTDNYYYKILIN